jgi:hypothetical protein
MANSLRESEKQAEFEYRFSHPVTGYTPGAHRSKSIGTGDLFAAYADLLDHPELRNLDVRASVRESLGQTPYKWRVRRYQQRSEITLTVLGDVSGSVLSSDGQQRLAGLMQLVAQSAVSLGDRFAFAGFDAAFRKELTIMPTKQRGFAQDFSSKLAALAPSQAAGVGGMMDAVSMLPQRPGIVFWVSDFCFDVAETERALRLLSHHMVVPIVWQNPAAIDVPSHAGWTEVVDSETGERRSLWMRQKFKARWQQSMDDHFIALEGCFSRYRLKPLFIDGELSGEQLTEYFSGIYRNSNYVKK